MLCVGTKGKIMNNDRVLGESGRVVESGVLRGVCRGGCGNQGSG